MALWGPESYWLVRLLFRRGLALVYLVAFLVAATQFRPLAGEDGLLPIDRYVDGWTFLERPSLFHRFPDDRVIGIAAWTGVALSALAVLGVTEWFGTPVSMLSWATLWLLYLSFVNAGQTFYGFGWESMLLETGFLAVFLGGPEVAVGFGEWVPAGALGAEGLAAPAVIVWLLRWVLFRDMFGSGLIKLRGDECWRNLTCLDYHYETQPMPNAVSWFAHHFPTAFHRVGVAANHVVQLVVPFFYFAPQPFAAVAGAATIGFQGWLLLTGNFSWLNFLSVVLATTTFSDGVLASAWTRATDAVGLAPVVDPSAGAAVPTGGPVPASLTVVVAVVALAVLALSVRPTRNMLSSGQVMNTSFDPLHLVNTYGAFGSVTRERYELVVQGTRDAEVTPETEWETYTFPGKPTDPARRPPQVAPYHHRLGWQLWFAAMSTPRRHPWFFHLLAKLLQGDEGTRSLLRTDPFPDDPPEHVRAVRYRYRFTTPAERRETGDWWVREREGPSVGPVSLEDRRFRSLLRRQGWGPVGSAGSAESTEAGEPADAGETA